MGAHLFQQNILSILKLASYVFIANYQKLVPLHLPEPSPEQLQIYDFM